MNREDIVREARVWLGTKWQHQGRTIQGIDCAGLIALVGMKLGLTSHNPTDYPRRPDGTFVKHFQAHLNQKPVNKAKTGDVLVFAESGHGYACHCGIQGVKYGKPSVIHAHAHRRKVMEETLEQAKSVIGTPIYCFEYPGVAD